MRVTRFIIVALFLLAFSQAALAQQGPGPSAQGTGKSATPEEFKDKKDRILKMIEERRAHLEKAKACVEAAKTDDDLLKCRPERPMGMGPGGMRRGGLSSMQGGGPGMQGGGPREQMRPTPPADQQQ